MLVLDFDGVISDSAPETFVVAVRAYAALWPESAIADASRALGSDAELTREGVRMQSLYTSFLDHMPLGSRAREFAAILAVLGRGEELHDQAACDRELEATPEDRLGAYDERFYRVRAELREAHPEVWHGLMGPYPEFLEVLRRLHGRYPLAIATSKDGATVRILLEDYGIADLFAGRPLLDKDAGDTKRAHLEHLHETSGLAYTGMTFVDDKVSHLDAVASLGVSCVLARWGYNGPRERVVAASRGYPVCTPAQLEAALSS
jgi:phosphoglycolate phosphatase-like HAD superfamily hydrolase